jgi:2-methylcitrate dehydratase PrpD
MTVVSELVKFASGNRYDSLPPQVVEHARKAVLDTLGVLIAGSTAPGVGPLRNLIHEWGGKAESSILVFGHRVPAPHAVWVNGAMARAQDFDDFHEKAIVHSAASIVPVCLAVAEKKGRVTGKEFISAVVLGMETMIRLGLSLDRSAIVSGISSTYQLGAFACALSAGKLLGLDEKGMSRALGIAYSQAAGNQQCVIEGSMMVHLLQGLSARAGTLSALLGQYGIDGPLDPLQGESGYFSVMHRNLYDPSKITRDLGVNFEMMGASLKYFPCCLCSHAAISAVLDLARRGPINPREVAEIHVGLNQGSFNIVCHPLERKRNPPAIKDAQFSLPYTVAAALVRGGVFLEDFTEEAIRDREVLSLAGKITPFVDRAIEEEFGRTLGPAAVEVVMRDGARRLGRVDFVKGHPRNPMTLAECEEKFRKCAPFSAVPLKGEKISGLIEGVRTLERLSDVSILADYLT